jgi:hypothetical protein
VAKPYHYHRESFTSDATQEERCIVWILSPWIEGDVSNVDIDGNNAL